MLKEILEYTSDPLREANVNDETKVIHGISLMNGFKSRNGWTYTEQAFEDIAERSEGVPVYWDHFSDEDKRSRQGVRSVRAIAGKIQNARRMSAQIKGDLAATEQSYPAIKELVRLNIKGLGMSYALQGKSMVDKAGNETVVSVPNIWSSDIVSQAALNSTFFESYTAQNTSNDEEILSGTIKQISENKAIIEKDGFISEINLSEFDKAPTIGDQVEFIVEDRAEIKTEGIIGDQIAEDEKIEKANSLIWKARSMISTILQDKEIKKFADRKKKIINVLDDLEAELSKIAGKILPKIEPTKDEEVESMALSTEAIKGLESIGEKAKVEEDKEEILMSVKLGSFGAREDDPITKQENERMRDAEKEKERRESRADNISEKDKSEIIASVSAGS